MERKKLAKIAMLTATLGSGLGGYLANSNQAVAQIYVPTNYYLYSSCTKEQGGPGGQCQGGGGNCLSSVTCG